MDFPKREIKTKYFAEQFFVKPGGARLPCKGQTLVAL
jgi:hypothetical protein